MTIRRRPLPPPFDPGPFAPSTLTTPTPDTRRLPGPNGERPQLDPLVYDPLVHGPRHYTSNAAFNAARAAYNATLTGLAPPRNRGTRIPDKTKGRDANGFWRVYFDELPPEPWPPEYLPGEPPYDPATACVAMYGRQRYHQLRTMYERWQLTKDNEA